MSKVTVLVGLQWGDEGKGKIVDILSPDYDVVARYQGGANAGHTIVFNNKKYVLHLIPSGIFNKKIICVIGNGTVIDLEALNDEIEIVKKENLDISSRLLISGNAHVILQYHKIVDAINESKTNKIGTTKKGIGPCYFDKYARRGIKIQDIAFGEGLLEKISDNLNNLKKIFPDSLELKQLSPEKIHDDLVTQFTKVKNLVSESHIFLNKKIYEKKNILLEGAQGALLDVDFGTYPFITSSHPTTGGASIGTGIPANKINSAVGIFKAYLTRVGEGPFPTELFDENGKTMSERGNEFGATTGRPRRCGWLDLVAFKYAVIINGITDLVITKSDVLDTFDEIKICTSYNYEGNIISDFPSNPNLLSRVKPNYEIFKGWRVSLNDIKKFSDLPVEFKDYISFIEDFIGVKIKYISTGPSREEIIISQ